MSVNRIKFSDICGENVELSEDNSVAAWNPKISGGWACCDHEVQPGECIEVTVEGSGRCDIGFMKEEQESRSFRTLNEIRVHRKTCRIPVTFSGTEIASVFNDSPFKREIKKGTKVWIAIFIRYGSITAEFVSNDTSQRSPKFSSDKHGPNILLENDNTRATSARKSPASICCISEKLQLGDKIKLICSPEKEGGREINRYELKLLVSQICPEDLKRDFKFLFGASEVIEMEVPLTTVECIEKDECNGDILISLTNDKAIQYTTAKAKQNTQPLRFDVENGVWVVLEIYGLKVRVSSETSVTSPHGNTGIDQPDSLPAGQTSHVTDAQLDEENNPTCGSGENVNTSNLTHEMENLTVATQESQQNVSTGTPMPVPPAARASGNDGEDRPNLQKHFPVLVREMETMVFCDHFYAKGIITESQMDEIHTIVRSKGRTEANRELIKMISRKKIKRSDMEEIAEEAHQSHLIELFYPTENKQAKK